MLICKKRSIPAIWKDMLSMMRKYGFENVGYAGYPEDPWKFNKQKKSSLTRKLFDYNNKPFCGGLSSAPAEMNKGYFAGYLFNDPLTRQAEIAERGSIISSDLYFKVREYQSVACFFKDWQVPFRIVIPLPSLSEHWYPILSASGNLSHNEGRTMLASYSGAMLERLQRYNLELMLHHGEYFNPFRSHQVFSEQAQEVLKRISSGYTNKQGNCINLTT